MFLLLTDTAAAAAAGDAGTAAVLAAAVAAVVAAVAAKCHLLRQSKVDIFQQVSNASCMQSCIEADHQWLQFHMPSGRWLRQDFTKACWALHR